MIWITPLTLQEINERARGSLSDHLGIEFTAVDDNSLTATMLIRPHTMQPMGIVHGGASAALAETVGSAAGNYCVDQKKAVCVGIELNINHLRMMRSGLVKATASPLHLGKQTQVWDIRITEESGKLSAIARLTLMVILKK
ncbi:MAG: PaaI family thioesterase [Verrucomicrobiota bacterium]|nr:PaaI family thioesterase [Verrucomicrobiota bacterium]